MNTLRTLDRKTLTALVAMIAFVLLCAQSVTLHVHSFNHDPHQNHHDDIGLQGHQHIDTVHLSSDHSHSEHHIGSTPVMDAAPDGISSQVSINLLFMALLVYFAIVLAPLNTRWYRDYTERSSQTLRYFISPPLRAPPLSV